MVSSERNYFNPQTYNPPKLRKKCLLCKLTIPDTERKANKLYCSPTCRTTARNRRFAKKRATLAAAKLRSKFRLQSLRDQAALLERN